MIRKRERRRERRREREINVGGKMKRGEGGGECYLRVDTIDKEKGKEKTGDGIKNMEERGGRMWEGERDKSVTF